MIHLAGFGAEYRADEGPRAARIIDRPTATLCGRPIAERTWNYGRVIFPFESPHACGDCIAARADKGPTVAYAHTVGVLFAHEMPTVEAAAE